MRLLLIMLVCATLGTLSVRAHTKTDSLFYNHSTLNLGFDTTLFVTDSPTVASNCNYSIKTAALYAYLHLGETYKYGDATFTGSVDITIEAYSTYSGTSGLVATYEVVLNIDEDAPEEFYLKDFTADHGSINRFEVSINSYSSSALIQDSIKLALFFKEDFGIDVSGTSLTNQVITPANPTNFAWSNDCDDIPNYELQLLRLFNTDSARNSNEEDIKFEVDWAQALSIETGNSDTSIELTLAAGRGYYIWRVRPIGTEYSGGIADSRNWGSWSTDTYEDGDIDSLSSTTATADKFFYYQFDGSLNWIYSRAFSEGDPISPKVRISERMTYANGLQQARQNLAHLQTEDEILVNQTVLDWSGRPALTTMAAPDTEDSLGYRTRFIKTTDNSLYTALNFDDDINYTDPDSLVNGILADYYSDANSDATIPNAEGYPFSRALYERDGTGRVREEGGPGGTHRIKPTNDHTTKTYYSAVSDAELIRIFGDEAPAAESVHKTINEDANKTATVTYISKAGQTIATCLLIGSNDTILDTLSGHNSAAFTVNDTLSENTQYEDYGSTSSKSLAFVTTTTVYIYYSLSSKEIEHICANYCRTCDYKVDLLIHKDDTTLTYSHLIAADTCNQIQSWDTTFNVSLSAGSYLIEKRVYANNINISSGTDSTEVMSFLEVHLDSLDSLLQGRADDSLSTIMGYLSSSSLDSLWDYLGVVDDTVNMDSLYQDSVIFVNIGCDSIAIPIMVCESYNCSDSTPDFEGYFNDRWVGTAYDEDNGTYLNFLNVSPHNYTPGQFNYMVANMIEGDYSCEDLWDCWDKVTQSYEHLLTLADTTDYHFDLLIEFLNCTGRQLKGYSTDTAYYRGKAYAFFNYTYGDQTLCDSMVTSTYGDTTSWGQDDLTGDFENKYWESYYNCTIWIDTSLDTTVAVYAADAECICLGVCDLRYGDFVQSLIRMYHNDSIYVEGDIFMLQKDTTWGQEYGWSNDSLPDPFTNYIDMDDIECAAYSLVEHCKDGCDLTIYKTNGKVDSVGSPAELASIEKSMTWTYDLSRLACGTGYDSIYPPSTSDTTLITLWDQHYGGDTTDQLWAIAEVKLGCGGYVLGGWTASSDTLDVSDTTRGTRDFWVVKVNDDGTKIWDAVIGGDSLDEMRSIIETSDGGFLLGGFSISDSTDDKTDSSRWDTYDYWVVKLDRWGKVEWDKTYGGDGDDRLSAMVETFDHYYIIGGSSNSGLSGDKTDAAYGSTYSYWALRIDTGGTIDWDVQYGTSYEDRLTDIIETQDSNWILAGHTKGDGDRDMTGLSNGGGGSYFEYWIIKIDDGGYDIWDKNYGAIGHDRLYSIVQASDGDFVLAGVSDSDIVAGTSKSFAGYGASDYWVLKVNDDSYANDTIRWDSTYGGSGADGYASEISPTRVVIKETADKGFLVGGFSNSAKGTGVKTDTLYGEIDYWMVRTDSVGNKLWDKSYGGEGADMFTTLDIDKNDYFWFAGYSNSDTTGNKTVPNYNGSNDSTDYWIIKAKEYCTHDTICFKWTQHVFIAVDSNTVLFDPISCDSNSAAAIEQIILQQVGEYVQAQKELFADDYLITCADPDSILDTMAISYSLGLHHYTLYYYDRAGNLVRTVPPKGVVLTASDRGDHPAHTFVTKYEYNSLKQLILQFTPDGDTTQFWYDLKGQLRFSRNAQQKLDSTFSYTKYDALGRITEVGQSSEDYLTFDDSVETTAYPDTATQRTYTVYTISGGVDYIDGSTQRYLQNRVSYTYTDDGVYTYFSYDPHGNVEWLIQDLPGLGMKYTGYEYDLISNNVLAVHYNEGAVDAFHHRYRYDADQRITLAETAWGQGTDLDEVVGWDKDASYSYYRHGPLKRMEIGEDKIQGLDYVYTLQGWLKGINHPSLILADDPGGDTDNDALFGKDMFGMVLGYHADDFNRSGSPYNPSTNSLMSSQTASVSNLYNGNISNWTLKRDSVSSLTTDRKGFLYRYDQLNRIISEDYWKHTGSWTSTSDYDNALTYDANGNIQSLNRNGYTAGGLGMDSMTYEYYSGTNRLDSVVDAVSSSYTTDIDDQGTNNYKYDAIGNLIEDIAEGIDTILWTVYGKVQAVVKTDGDSVEFTYDAAGNRISKEDNPSGSSSTVTYYVRDASGNVMSMYERTTSGANYVYSQNELPIYGISRVGIYKPNITVTTADTSGIDLDCFTCDVFKWTVDLHEANGYFGRDIAKRNYELTDHLGNVRIIVSDRKYADGVAVGLSVNNYYAFGMSMPNMSINLSDYRYGFNGMEADDEIISNKNSYTAAFWQYDPRLGRRWNIDPVVKYHESPYAAFANNPVWFIDPFGDDTLKAGSEDPVKKGDVIDFGEDEFVTATTDEVEVNQLGMILVTVPIESQDESAMGLVLQGVKTGPQGALLGGILAVGTIYRDEIIATAEAIGELVVESAIDIFDVVQDVSESIMEFSQHGTNRGTLGTTELEILRAKEEAGTLSGLEKKKLTRHDKNTGDKHSRKSNDKK